MKDAKMKLTIYLSLSILLPFLRHNFLALIVIQSFTTLDNVSCEPLTNHVDNFVSDKRILNDQKLDELEDNALINDGDVFSNLIEFTPKELNFKERSLGISLVNRVIVKNLQVDESIQMLSISGNSVHFHCSFFEDRIIKALSNTSFEIVFLPRQEGLVINDLYIHTSIGSFKYSVSGIGISNPYRLRPFVGVRVPLNSSYSSLINIYNPHSLTLQLTEMYSTGGGLHLELPNGESESTEELWQIPPFETRPIIKAHFLARSEKNHTAFIRIKTNSSDESVKDIIILVEVEVSSASGIYSPVDILDFGVRRSFDDPIEMSLKILNSGSKPISIQNVIATPFNEALDIKLNQASNLRMLPNIYHPVEIAKLVLRLRKISICSRQCFGKIMIKSKNNQYKLAIPYQISLLSGQLEYNSSQTQFYINPNLDSLNIDKRLISFKNLFNFTVAIKSLSLPDLAKPYFKVAFTNCELMIKPNETKSLVSITFTPSRQLTQLEAYFRLHTNVSYFDIKLNAYSGKLDLFIPHSLNQLQLDFGTLSLKTNKSMIFSLINNNPIDVHIQNWYSDSKQTFFDLIKIDKGNGTITALKNNFSKIKRSNRIFLKPKHYCLFRLNIISADEERSFAGETVIVTNFETLRVAFKGRVIEGSLSSNPIVIKKAFPGLISSHTIKVNSSFSSNITLKSMSINSPSDFKFNVEPNVSDKIVLSLGENDIGQIYFDPYQYCGPLKTCYSGLETSKEVGHLWLLGLTLHSDTGYIDKELHTSFYSRWANLKSNEKLIQATLDVKSEIGPQLFVDVQAHLEWPRLIRDGKNNLEFPLTRIGNITFKEVFIDNPSSHPVLAQIILLSDYPNPDAALQTLKNFKIWTNAELQNVKIKPQSFKLFSSTSTLTISESYSSAFQSSQLSSLSSNSSNYHTFSLDSILNSNRIKETFSVTPAPNSLTLVLPVGSTIKVTVGFTPQPDIQDLKDESEWTSSNLKTLSASTFLLIRNNLTILDGIHISAKGSLALLKLGNQLPGIKSSLVFNLQEKHLKNCNSFLESQQQTEPSITVHKSFNLVNFGDLPIHIKGFLISPQIGPRLDHTDRMSYEKYQFDLLGTNRLAHYFIRPAPCRGVGFKVFNCNSDYPIGSNQLYKLNSFNISHLISSFSSKHKLILKPNESKRINIAFTPDFTQTKISAILTIITDYDDLNYIENFLYQQFSNPALNIQPPIQYTLTANIPKHLSSFCSSSLPRPEWESVFYHALVIFVISINFSMIILAFSDGTRILNVNFYPAIMMTKATSLSYERENEPIENMELLEQIMDLNISEKEKKYKKGTKTGRKVAKESVKVENEKLTLKEVNHNLKSKIFNSAQSLTAFLKQPFGQSFGQNNIKENEPSANLSIKSNSKTKRAAIISNLKSKNEPKAVKLKLNNEPNNLPNILKKKSKSYLSSLASSPTLSSSSSFSAFSSSVIPSTPPLPPPPPLPSFPSGFEDKFKLQNKSSKIKKGTTKNDNLQTSNQTTTAQSESRSNSIKNLKLSKSCKKNSKVQEDSIESKKSKEFEDKIDTWSDTVVNDLSKSWNLEPVNEKSFKKSPKPLIELTNTTNLNPVPASSTSYKLKTSENILVEDSFQNYVSIVTKNVNEKKNVSNQTWQPASSSIQPSQPPSSAPPYLISAPSLLSSLSSQSKIEDRFSNFPNRVDIVNSNNNSWIADALLDNQLTMMKNSNINDCFQSNHNLDHGMINSRMNGSAESSLPQQSRLKEWTRIKEVETGASQLWSSCDQDWLSNSAQNLGSTSKIDSSQLWNNNLKSLQNNVWQNDCWFSSARTCQPDHTPLMQTLSQPNSRYSPGHQNFSLFGRSSWSPIPSPATINPEPGPQRSIQNSLINSSFVSFSSQNLSLPQSMSNLGNLYTPNSSQIYKANQFNSNFQENKK